MFDLIYTTGEPLLAVARRMSFGESLSFILAGFILVVLVLGLLWACCTLLGRWFISHPAPQPQQEASGPQAASGAAMQDTHGLASASASATNAEEDARITAVVSAAVYCCLGARSRIVSIRPTSESAAWSSEGRRSIFQSHRVR